MAEPQLSIVTFFCPISWVRTCSATRPSGGITGKDSQSPQQYNQQDPHYYLILDLACDSDQQFLVLTGPSYWCTKACPLMASFNKVYCHVSFYRGHSRGLKKLGNHKTLERINQHKNLRISAKLWKWSFLLGSVLRGGTMTVTKVVSAPMDP